MTYIPVILRNMRFAIKLLSVQAFFVLHNNIFFLNIYSVGYSLKYKKEAIYFIYCTESFGIYRLKLYL